MLPGMIPNAPLYHMASILFALLVIRTDVLISYLPKMIVSAATVQKMYQHHYIRYKFSHLQF
jgi:hypothetical protein